MGDDLVPQANLAKQHAHLCLLFLLFMETISTVKEGEETDKSESASSVLKVCDNVIINSLIAFLSGPTSSSDHNCIVVT